MNNAIAFQRFYIFIYLLRDNSFYDGGGLVLCAAIRLGTGAKALAHSVALEYADIAFSAVQDHSLFQHGNALKLLGTPVGNARLKGDLYIKTHGNGMKSTVELDGVNADISPNDFCTSCSDRSRALQNVVAEIRKVNTHVFKAITVSAGI